MTDGSPDVLPAATRRPRSRTPDRVPGSIRRASHIGVRLQDESTLLHVHGAVRDVVTDGDGDGYVVGAATLECVVAADRSVVSIRSEPDEPALAQLTGCIAHRGWRAASRELVGGGTPLASLLDDVPIALLLSSYGALRKGSLQLTAVQPMMLRMRNLCAGWADGATPMRTLDAGRPMPLPGVVPVPADTQSDPLATEPRPPLAPEEVRRVRRVEVVPGSVVRVEADFRDTYCNGAGDVGVLHEYLVRATVSPKGVVESIDAEPRVLPYDECTFAAASPQRLVGRRIEDVAEDVRAGAGTATCSHLDDLLRSLAAVPELLRSGTAGDATRADW